MTIFTKHRHDGHNLYVVLQGAEAENMNGLVDDSSTILFLQTFIATLYNLYISYF